VGSVYYNRGITFSIVTTEAIRLAQSKFGAAPIGGEAKLKGMKIVNLHLKHPYGNETIPVWDKMAEEYGFEVTHIAVPWPGIDQKSLWLQVRKIKPAFVINRNWGVSCTVPLREAARIGFPRDHIIGVWWCGSEEDVIPAGKAAAGYITAAFHAAGTDYPVIDEIFEHVYGKMKGNLSAAARVGSVYYNRGITFSIVTTEAIRLAQSKFGAAPIGGEEMRWALENLEITEDRLKELGASGFLPPFKVTCFDHEGSGSVKFQQWNGKKWEMITDWVPPYKKLVRGMIEASAAKYAKEKGITPRSGMSMDSDCG
jgi:branched-chain amino acid transport system substrate-binding protein